MLHAWILQALEGQHGSMLALGYLMGEIYNQRKAVISGTILDDMEVDSSDDSKVNEAFTKATKAIGKMIVEKN